jgi:hypothetical protein
LGGYFQGVNMIDETTKKICPICKRDDSIQRLSAIVASGTASGTFSGPSGGITHSGNETGTYGGYTTLSGTSMSNLARSLSLPNDPKFPTIYTPVETAFLSILILVAGIVTLGLGFIVAILSLLVVVSRGPIVIGDPKQEIAKYTKNLVDLRLAKDYWLSLYYCHKDGIVFDPSKNEYCPPEETVTFVYRHIQEIPLERFENVYAKIGRASMSPKTKIALEQVVHDFLLNSRHNNKSSDILDKKIETA